MVIKCMLISYFVFCFFLFKAALTAYGSSQARGQIRAVVPNLRDSHSKAGSKPHLQPTPQLTASEPLSKARHQIHVLMGMNWVRFPLPAAVAPTGPLAWEPPYAVGVALKSKRKKENIWGSKKYINYCLYFLCHNLN